MEIHKKKCVCGHLLDVEDIYQQGKADERARVLEIVKELKSLVNVNRVLDDIVKDKPKELGMLIAYDKVIEKLKEQKNEKKD